MQPWSNLGPKYAWAHLQIEIQTDIKAKYTTDMGANIHIIRTVLHNAVKVTAKQILIWYVQITEHKHRRTESLFPKPRAGCGESKSTEITSTSLK